MSEVDGSLDVGNVTLVVHHGGSVGARFCGRRVSRLGPTRPLLTREVLLGETLLPCLGLPVIIADSSSINYYSAAKLSEHRPSCYYRDLPRPVGEGQYILADQVLFLVLGGYDFIQRSILVEEQVRVSVCQHARALSRQHEELVAAVRNVKGLASVCAAALEESIDIYLLLAGLIVFTRYVLVVSWSQLVRGMVPDGWQCLYHRLRSGLER